MGYCSVDDVCAEFPSFQRNVAGDIQDTQIQSWINRAAAMIAAALVQRGFDPDSPPTALTTRQSDLLAELNAQAGVHKLGSVLQARVSLQTGDAAMMADRGTSIKQILKDIRAEAYDGIFGIESRLVDGNAYAGADTDKSTPEERGENRAFGMTEEF